MRLILSFLLALFLTPIAFSAKFDQTQLQKMTQQFYAENALKEHFSGVAVTLLTKPGMNPLSAFVGTTKRHGDIPLTQDHLFQIGSITKSFISAAVLRLATDPKTHFSLETPIHDFFPEYPAWGNVTVKELLNMTSGIPNYLVDPSLVATFSQHPYLSFAPTYWINATYQKPMLFTPGQGFVYSNTNYLLLGMLVERVSGHSLADEIKTEFIKPLKLTHTYFQESLLNTPLLPKLVHGYQYQTGFQTFIPMGTDVTTYNLSYLNAAGGMISNSEDVAKWVNALFSQDVLFNKTASDDLLQFVSLKTGQPVTHLSRTLDQSYGLGVGKRYLKALDCEVYIYQGITFGYRTLYIHIPNKGLTIVVMVNSGYYQKDNALLSFITQIAQVALGT